MSALEIDIFHVCVCVHIILYIYIYIYILQHLEEVAHYIYAPALQHQRRYMVQTHMYIL